MHLQFGRPGFNPWVKKIPGREDLLEKGMATHYSILAWEISWTEESDGLQFIGSQKVRHSWARNTFTFTMDILFLQFPESEQSFTLQNQLYKVGITKVHSKTLRAVPDMSQCCIKVSCYFIYYNFHIYYIICIITLI